MVEMSVEEARPLLREFPVRDPTGVGFIENAGLATGPNPDEFEALAARYAVFRLHLLRGAAPPAASGYPVIQHLNWAWSKWDLFGRRE
jgi:hypothetical protein